MRHLQGTVFSGAGIAGDSLKPLLHYIRKLTGLHSLLPQTLNIRLPIAYTGTRDFVLEAKAYSHYEDVYLERCRIRGLDALIMRTSTNYHGASVLEIMAEVWLKREFGIADGDIETVEVFTAAG
jgi:CTP-dependent riboflavin kinase